MKVILSDSEIELCKLIAKLRYQEARSHGVVDQRLDDSGELLDLNGFGAELAFCKKFNLYPDFTIGVRQGGHDVLTHKGTKVDIKCTKYKSGHLIATKNKKLGESDIYVLVIGEMPEYDIVGFIEEELFLIEENLKDFGHGVGYALEQSKLKSFL